MGRVDHNPAERLDLALHQQPRDRRQEFRDPSGRGVGAVRGAEGVVDIQVAEAGELPGKGRVILRLARVEADVLQQDDVAVRHRLDSGLDRRTNAIIEMAHLPPQ